MKQCACPGFLGSVCHFDYRKPIFNGQKVLRFDIISVTFRNAKEHCISQVDLQMFTLRNFYRDFSCSGPESAC